VTGCGTVAHDRAVTRAQAWADAHGVEGKVTCSSGLKPPSALAARPDFICLVRRAPLDCTVLHVSGRNGFILVRVIHRHGECAQPL
jgi:hypothetical protein